MAADAFVPIFCEVAARAKAPEYFVARCLFALGHRARVTFARSSVAATVSWCAAY
jgi:hypothetical protein